MKKSNIETEFDAISGRIGNRHKLTSCGEDSKGVCRFCGNESAGKDFAGWVKETFTDFDKLREGSIICNDCLFWFDVRSTGFHREQHQVFHAHIFKKA